MGDMGLESAFGNASMADQIRQRIKDQIEAQQRAQALAQQQFQNQRQLAGDERQTRQLDQNDQLRRDTLAETTRQHTLTDADRVMKESGALNDQVPAGTELAPSSPIVGRLQSVGALKPNMTLPSTQTSGGVSMPDDSGATITGTLRSMSSPEALRSYTKLASQKQQTTADESAAKVEAARLAAENRTNDNEQKQKDRLAQIAAGAAARPQKDVIKRVEHRDPDTGKTIIEYLPESQLAGRHFDKGASAATETRIGSAQAVNQTGEDIIKQINDPKVSALLGPAMGRYNSVRDFIGNPPPELSELAGAIESYALANMGVHGMRSAVGAEQIKKLLDKKHTPESLASTIRGLSMFSQHFMENEGRSGAPPAAAGAGKRIVYDINGNPVK